MASHLEDVLSKPFWLEMMWMWCSLPIIYLATNLAAYYLPIYLPTHLLRSKVVMPTTYM